MTFSLKSLAVLALACGLTTASNAATVGASGNASVFVTGTTAYDLDGNYDDPLNWLSFSGQNEINTSSFVTLPNTTASTAEFSRTYTVTNTSKTFFIDWLADIMINTFASGNIDPDVAGDFYFDSNTFLTAGTISSFASVNTSYSCRVPDPLDPAYDCFGAQSFFSDPQSTSEFGTLEPGQSITFTLTAQSFATQRFTPAPATVPLPASGVFLMAALTGFGALRARRKPASTLQPLKA